MIKRYEFYNSMCDCYCQMEEKSNGRYTLYSDTKILIDALEEIKKEFKWTHSNGVCAACIAITH